MTGRRIGGLLIVTIAIGASGCSANSNYDVPESDRERAVLPLDSYRVPIRSQFEQAYIRDLFIEDCMAEIALEVTAVRPVHIPAEDEGAGHAVQFAIQTPEHAAEVGYRITLDPGRQAEYDAWAERTAVINALSPEDYESLSTCYDTAVALTEEALGGSLYELQHANELAFGVRDSLLSPAVVDTLEPWRECVVHAGLDVPVGTTPRDMPTDPYRERIKAAADPWGEERRIAEIDTACREQVGFGEAYFASVVAEEADIVRENQGLLVSVRERIRTIQGRIPQVITELEAGR